MTDSYKASQAEFVAGQLAESFVPEFIRGLEAATGKDLKHLKDEMAKDLTTSLAWTLKGFENMTLERAALTLDELDTKVAAEHAARIRGLLNDLSGFQSWIEGEQKR